MSEMKENSDGALSTRGEKAEHNSAKQEGGNKSLILFLPVVLSVVLFIICVYLAVTTLSAGAKATVKAFGSAEEKTAQSIYDDIYQKSYEKAEEKHHVSNRVTISVEALREESKLEVLKVSDVYYAIYDDDKEGAPVITWVSNLFTGDIKAWLEIPGDAVYTVNLKKSEFIIDQERQHILIRVPKPELSDLSIGKVEILNVEQTGFIPASKGVKLAEENMVKAYDALQKSMTESQQYYKSAEDSARSILTNLLMELNPQAENLTVDVEFIK